MDLISLGFAENLKSNLKRGTYNSIGNGCIKVAGKLRTEMAISPIEIIIPPGNRLRENPPTVHCRESWMRDCPNWHNSKEHGMCWVLREQWHDEMSDTQLTTKDLLEFGPQWLIAGVTSLIDRHYVGYINKLSNWPGEWLAYAHFDKGLKQYDREKRR